MPPRRPVDLHPDLTDDRLNAAAQVLWDARAQVADAHLPELGDDNYVLGTRGWSASKYFLTAQAESGEWDWFGIVDPQRPTFRIGTVAIGFYRGDADHPHGRTLRQSLPELKQNSFALGEEKAEDRLYRFAITLDGDGGPDEVVFVVFNAAGQQELYFPIPVATRPPTLRVINPSHEPPTAAQRPTVRVRRPDSGAGNDVESTG